MLNYYKEDYVLILPNFVCVQIMWENGWVLLGDCKLFENYQVFLKSFDPIR